MTTSPAAGWYPDPSGQGQLRYWSGSVWTEWVSTDGEMVADPLRARRRLDVADVVHLTFVDEVFVPEAQAAGVVDAATAQGLSELAARLAAEALQAPLTADMATARTGSSTTRAWAVSSVAPEAVVEPATPVAEPRVKEPGPLRQWWQRSRVSIGSDLAVHGLAYLGALLLFVGAFGLVAFAFGGVERTWRPVAEVAIAAVPFLTAGLLLRRGAEIVGRSLELAGGLLLPVMVMTVFLDDVPPDLDGLAMVVGMTVALLAVGAGYAAWSRRHVDSALRFVVAPMVWLAAGVAAMGVGRALPAGAAVASLTAAQVAAIAVALASTLALARRRPDHPLSSSTLTSAVPGAVAVAVMAVLTWLAEDWPLLPVLVTGVAGLLALDLLDVRVPAPAVAVAQPVWWAVVSLALLAAVGPGPAGVVAALGFGVLLERTATRRPDVLPLGLSAGGAVVAFALTIAEPWYGVALAAAGGLWAGWRRLRSFELAGADSLLDVAAGLIPLLGVAWLAVATDSMAVPVAAGSGLVLLAALLAARGLLRRDEADRFWTTSWAVSAVIFTLALAAAWGGPSAPGGLTWLLPLSAAVLTAAACVGPMAALARPWAVLGLGTLTWVLLGLEVTVEPRVLAVVVAGAGLLVVVAAHTVRGRMAAAVAGSLGLAGHVMALGALPAAGRGPALAVAAGAATLGFLLTAAADAREQSPVGSLLAAGDPVTRYLPPALAAAGLPVTAAATAAAAGVEIWADPWPLTALLAVTALGYGLLTRTALALHAGRTAVWAASVAAVLAAATASDRPTALVGLGVLTATAWVIPAARRPAPMAWLGLAALAPLVALSALALSPAVSASPVVEVAAVALVGVGAVLTIGGLALVGAGEPSARRLRTSRPELLAAVVTGAVEVFAGLALAVVAVSTPTAGWLTLAVAAVVLVVAVLRRIGALSGLAVVLAWTATVMIAGQAILDRPWVALLVGGGLLLLADGARSWARQPWWARWDLPVFAAAHLVVATGVLSVVESDERALVVATVGLLALVVAWWLRASPVAAPTYAAAGGALVLAGAIDAGPGWSSLALLAIAAALVVLAAQPTAAGRRLWLQIASAVVAVASWQQATTWWELATQRTVDVTVLGGGLLVTALAAALLVRPSARSWVLTWGGVATLVVLSTGLAALSGAAGDVSGPVVAGSGLLALAWVGAAVRVDGAVLRTGALGLLLVTEVQVLALADASPTLQVAVLSVTAALATLVALAPAATPGIAGWQRPALALAVVSTLGASGVAWDQRPDTLLLVPTLLVAAGVAAAAGVLLSSVWLRVLAPLLACAAWLVYASGALDDNPQWYTVPMGLALLVTVGLLRQDARARGENPAAGGIVTLELVGVAFLVGASFVQAVTDVLAYVALAMLLGAAVGAWGLLTKVRRRLVAGGVVVLAAVVVLLAVPLVNLLPSWQGTALWIFLAGAGLVALLAATAIEKGRLVARKALARYVALGTEWE